MPASGHYGHIVTVFIFIFPEIVTVITRPGTIKLPFSRAKVWAVLWYEAAGFHFLIAISAGADEILFGVKLTLSVEIHAAQKLSLIISP